MPTPTVKISLRLDSAVHATSEKIAKKEAVSTEALIQRIVTTYVTKYARKNGLMGPEDIDRLEREQRIIVKAIRRAREVDDAGGFDEHFTLRVIRDLMTDQGFRADYETVIGGDAYENGLPGKFPLNMHLGWYIKNAIPSAASGSGFESQAAACPGPQRAHPELHVAHQIMKRTSSCGAGP